MKKKEEETEKQIQMFITNEELKKKIKKLKRNIKKGDVVKNSIFEPFYNAFIPFLLYQYKKYQDNPKKEKQIIEDKIDFMRKYVMEASDKIMDNYNENLIDKDAYFVSMNALLEIKKDFWVL